MNDFFISPADILRTTGVELTADQITALRADYAGASRGDLKKLGLQLDRFAPRIEQVLIAVALLVGGFLLTRKLGVEEDPVD